MPNHVVRFPQGNRHGWYLGRDEVVGLRPGREREWPELWSRYSQRTGQSVDDLDFTVEEQREEFRHEVTRSAANTTND